MLEQVRQGDGQAIATLLRQTFPTTQVKIQLKQACLRILLEADPLPDMGSTVASLRQVLLPLQPQGIQTIQVYGRCPGDPHPAWQQVLEPSPMPIAELRQLAAAGDEAALATLLTQALAHKQVVVQVSRQQGELQLDLQADAPLQAKPCLILLDRELTKLQPDWVQQVRVQQRSQTDQALWEEAFLLGAFAQQRPVVKKSVTTAKLPPAPPPRPVFQPVSAAAWRVLGLGGGLALLIFLSPFQFLAGGFTVLVHEVGHALTHWLFGRPAVPTINLLYGGGITFAMEDSSPIVLGIIYLGFAALAYFCRAYPRLLGLLAVMAGLYSWCLATPTNRMLSVLMGHGLEMLSIWLCLWLAVSGYFCYFSGDRTIYSLLGFSALLRNLRFTWQLLYDSEFRSYYEEGIGGVIDNDFVILARDYFGVDLSIVAGWFLVGCLLAMILAFGLYCCQSQVQRLITWLTAAELA